MSDPKYIAPEGQIWVCAACGKHGPDRMRIGDESCFMWANLCYADSLVVGDDGMVRSAKAVQE